MWLPILRTRRRRRTQPEPTAPAPDPTVAPEPLPEPRPVDPNRRLPTITSDLDDYPPGGLVTLTGSNWAPGELVHIFVNDQLGSSWNRNVDVVADSTGEIYDQFNLPNWFVAEYQVVASGPDSGVASHWFTDSQPGPSPTVAAPTSQTVTAGNTATYGNLTIVKNGNNTACTLTLSVPSGLPAGASPAFGSNPITMTNANVVTSVAVTTMGSTPAGTYTFAVRVTRGADCQGTTGTFETSNTLTLVVNPSANVAPVVTPAANQSATEGTAQSFTIGSFADAVGDTPWLVSIDWGDGSSDTNLTRTTTGTIPAQSHTYTDNTTPTATGYTVTVSVTDKNGGAGSATGTGTFKVTVTNVEPTLTVSGAASVAEGSLYSLTLGAIVDPGLDTVTNIRVHWGDSSFTDYGSTAGAKTHVYADGPATRTITVDITDEDGTFTDQANAFSVSVTNVEPTLTVSGAASVAEGSLYSLTLGAIVDPGLDTVTNIRVHWGDSSFTDYGSTAGAKTHVYADGPATRTITVDITDEDGTFTDQANAFSVSVTNVEPTLTVSGAASVAEGSLYSLTLGAIVDPGLDTVTNIRVHWGDSSFTDYGSTAGAKTHVYADGPATRTITVDITDEDGTFTDQANAFSVSVTNADPAYASPIDQGGSEGALETFGLGSFSDAGVNDDPWTIEVDWGDGSAVESFDLNVQGTIGTLSHTYDDEDTYTVTVTVTDKDGGDDTGTFEVTIANAPPVVTEGADDTSAEGETKAFDLGSFTDAGVNDDPWTVTVDWGDGDSDTFDVSVQGGLGTLSHSYAQDGPYTVTVTVEDEDGDSDSASFAVTVNNVAPDVSAGADDTIDEGDTFTGSGSFTDPGADTWTATVNYGEGAGVQPLTLVGQTFNLSNLYQQDGTYTVTVCVNDDDTFDCDSLTVTVNNVAPDVSAGADDTIDEGDTFTGSGSFTDPGADTWTATVNYGEGAGVQPLTLVGQTFNLSNLYQQDGTYTVTVCVNDDDTFDCDSLTVTVNNVAPDVSAGADDTIDEGDTFTGSGSFTDPGADTWTATVNYGEGAGVQPLTLVGQTFNLSNLYQQDGTYTVTVCVNDDDTFDCDSLTVTVNNVAPDVSAGADDTIDEGDTFTGSGSFTDPGADTWTATVNYGEGAGVQPLTLVGQTFNLSNLYQQDGTYTVTVCVNDDDTFDCDSLTVTVNNVAPDVSAGADDTIDEGDTFTGSGSFTDPGADTWTATVNYGEGAGVQPLTLVGQTFNLSNLYQQDGTYTVTVCVNDDDTFDCDSLTVTVNNVAPDVSAGADDTIDEGDTFTGSGSFTDPGADTWTATVNYGEGAGVQPLTLVGQTFNLSNLYQQDGTYTVTVCVNDDDTFDCDSLTVTVNNVAPDVSAGADDTIDEGDTFTGSGSFTDPGADTWTATVNYGEGAGVQPLTLVGQTFNLSNLYQQDGTYTVTVCVNDDDTFDCDSLTVTVNNVAPTVTLSAGNHLAVNEGSQHTYSFTTSDPGDDTFSVVSVSCGGNGSQVGSTTFNSATGAGSFVCTFPDGPNTSTVSVQVKDSDNANSNTATQDVAVANVKPTPTITSIVYAGTTACLTGNTVTLGFSWTDPAGTNDTYGYDVNWGDGNHTIVAAVPGVVSPVTGLTHTYAAGGPFLIVVTVNDSDSGVGTATAASAPISFLYTSTGIQQPINGTGPRSSFKIGSTIPVKLTIVDCTGAVVSGLTLTVGLVKVDTNADPANETVPASVPDVGQTMRANGPGGYIYNLSTKRSQLCSSVAPCSSGGDLTAGTYRLTISGALIAPIVAYFDAKQ